MVWNYTNYINHKVGNLLKVQLPVQLFFADAKEMWKPCFTLVLPAGCHTFPYGIRFDKDLQVTFHQPKEPFVQSRSFPVLRDEDNNSRSARQQTGQHQYFTAFQSQTSYLIACQSVLITWWSNSGLLFQKRLWYILLFASKAQQWPWWPCNKLHLYFNMSRYLLYHLRKDTGYNSSRVTDTINNI